MLIVLFMLLALRLLGFFLKIAGGVIKVIFRILIFPVLIITAIWGYPIVVESGYKIDLHIQAEVE